MLSITGKVSLDGKGWEAGLRNIEKSTNKFATNTLGNLKSQLAGAFAVGALAAITKKTIDYASHIQDMSEATGVSTTRLQEQEFALNQSGAEIGELVKAYKQLANARKAALKKPEGEEGKAFENFGIGMAQLRAIKDPSELFLMLSDSIKRMNMDLNSTPEILALIGGKGQAVIPALVAGVREATEEFQRMNGAIDPGTIKALDNLGDEMQKTMAGLRRPISEITLFFARELDGLFYLIGQIPDLWKANVTALGLEFSTVPFFRHIFGDKQFDELQAQHDKFAKKFQDRRTAFLNRHDPNVKGKPGGGIDIEPPEMVEKANKALEARERILERIAEKQRNLFLDSLTADEKMVELLKERKAILDQTGPQSLEQREKIVDLDQDIQNLNQSASSEKAGAPPSFNRQPSDSLLRVGNFLGQGSNAILSIQQKGLEYQRQIADGIKRLIAISQSQSGTSLSANTP